MQPKGAYVYKECSEQSNTHVIVCNDQGVTIPSQIRYIHYFERWLREGALNLRSYFLTDIIFHGVPKGVQVPGSARSGRVPA